MNNLNYELILSSKNLTTELIEKIKCLKISKEIIDKRVLIYNKEKLVVKYLNKYDIYPTKNAEFKISEDILNNVLSNSHLIDIYGLIKFESNNIKKPTIICKKNISPNVIKKRKLNENDKDDEDNDSYGIIMPLYETLPEYLEKNNDIDPKLLLSNILGILDLCINIRDTYKFYHKDVKIDNILIKDNIFYLIDWEFIIENGNIYFSIDRPGEGNTEMYPFYDATGEQFLIHSFGVLLSRIIGYNYNISYKDFMENYAIEYILSNIPEKKIKLYESIILNIYNKKYLKIEKLKDDISILLDNINNG
jgi:hypothetical protein